MLKPVNTSLFGCDGAFARSSHETADNENQDDQEVSVPECKKLPFIVPKECSNERSGKTSGIEDNILASQHWFANKK